MTDDHPRIRHGSARGEGLVAAWNRSDRTFIVDQLGDTVALEARHPKMPRPAPDLRVTTKAEFAAGLMAYPGPLPAFTIIGLFEDPDTICLVLEDADHDALAVTIELDSTGKIERIVSYRAGSEDETPPGRAKG